MALPGQLDLLLVYEVTLAATNSCELQLTRGSLRNKSGEVYFISQALLNPLRSVSQPVQGWKDGTAAKSSYCSCTEPPCSFLAPTWGSQLSVTLVLGDPIPILDSMGFCIATLHKTHASICRQKAGSQAKTTTVDRTEVQS